MADKECLSRIFNNLTSNTLKYANDKVYIVLEKMAECVSITYKNESGGLSEFDVNHLFDRYYRKNETGVANRSGLGLTIAKLLTEKMGGSMEAFLEKKWLVIRFTFPIYPK